jgi:hypothetical protein
MLPPEDSSGTPKPSQEMLVRALSCPLLSLHHDDHVCVMAKVVSGRCDGWEGNLLLSCCAPPILVYSNSDGFTKAL